MFTQAGFKRRTTWTLTLSPPTFKPRRFAFSQKGVTGGKASILGFSPPPFPNWLTDSDAEQSEWDSFCDDLRDEAADMDMEYLAAWFIDLIDFLP